MPRWLSNWRDRHRHPVSFVLHLTGIPMTIACVPLAWVQLADDRWDLWWRPVALLIVGYLLQWIGHVIEGNDMGEVILVKKWMGKPYVGVSPRYALPVESKTPRSDGPTSVGDSQGVENNA
ncbi:MAG: DUF962 domain-containing protein [Planctomycetota bacterium]|nr:DUF962 domain-containing protein [Planctomycetota bacterium]